MALAILEELAKQALRAPTKRPDWLRIVLAWLFARSQGESGFFDNYCTALASRDEVGRQQSLNASLTAPTGSWRERV